MSTNPKSIGVIGHGHFGQFLEVLVTRYLPETSVRIYSRRAEPDGERFFTLAATAASDVVILTGKISEYDVQLQSVLQHVRTDTIVVDVATVKKYTSELFRTQAGEQPYFCCHPMFGPESYKKCDGDVNGFRIVITDHTLQTEHYETVRQGLAGVGFSVIEMTADDHDKKLAETLFLTHYIAQTIKEGEFGRTDLDTVSFGSLMNAVESVQNDRQLFEDVYRYNPHCRAIAERFHAAQQDIYKSIDKYY